ASIGRHIAVRPGADQVFCHGQGAQFVGGEPRLVEIHRAGGGMEKPDVELVTQATFHRSVDEFSAGHGRAVGKSNNDIVAATAGDFREIVETNSNHGAVFRADKPSAGALD